MRKLYSLNRLTVQTAVEVLEELVNAGFDEASLQEFLKSGAESSGKKALSTWRQLKLLSEGLVKFEPIANPLIRVSYNAGTYHFNAQSIDQSFGGEDKEFKLKDFKLISPFIEGEEEVSAAEAFSRVKKYSLADPFVFGWFFSHEEMIPASWNGDGEPFLIFGGFPVQDNHRHELKQYPVLKRRKNSNEWDQDLVDASEGYTLCKGTKFVVI